MSGTVFHYLTLEDILHSKRIKKKKEKKKKTYFIFSEYDLSSFDTDFLLYRILLETDFKNVSLQLECCFGSVNECML